MQLYEKALDLFEDDQSTSVSSTSSYINWYKEVIIG
jgi:hypothetical protein